MFRASAVSIWAISLIAFCPLAQSQVRDVPLVPESRIIAPAGAAAAPFSLKLTLTPSFAGPSLAPSLSGSLVRKLLVEDKKRLTPSEFKAYVEGDPSKVQDTLDAAEKEPAKVKQTLRKMYGSLSALVGAGQTEAASAVAERFFDYLGELGKRETIAPWARGMAEGSSRRLADGTLVDALAAQNEARSRLSDLNRTLRPYRKAPGAPKTAEPRWKLPEFQPEDRRILGGDARKVRVETLAKIGEELAWHKAQLARPPLREYLQGLLPRLRDLKFRIDRFREVLFPRSFIASKKHIITGIPSNPNLRLTPEAGGFLLTARFKTDIKEKKVRAFFKASIEDYWRGSFALNGRTYAWRTVVTVEPLAPREQFPEDSLRLVRKEDRGGSTTSRGTTINLGRTPRYGSPAHEFGHVLGLADEYSDTYDFDAHRQVQVTLPGSLMGASETGVVLPRHLKLAYLLLRRRSLAPDLPLDQP